MGNRAIAVLWIAIGIGAGIMLGIVLTIIWGHMRRSVAEGSAIGMAAGAVIACWCYGR
jgi:hypothetical protein